MKSRTKMSAFTLVELLVVITILAIISAVAYTNFSWTTDKAKNSKKISDLASIETALQTFNQDKNYFPMPSEYDASKNVWWYSWTITAQASNTFSWSKIWDQIDSVSGSLIRWGWIVYQSWAATTQVWAKWVIDWTVLSKQYLSQELLDPSLKDIKVWNAWVFKDYWIGKYTYSVYAKPAVHASWNTTDKLWQAYNVAITLTDDQKTYVTKIIGNFDSSTCVNCPDTLIWTWSTSLMDWSIWNWSWAESADQWIPYPIAWF